MTNSKKILWWIVGIIVLIVIVLVAISSSRSNSNIKIGAIYPLTGGLASYGEPSQKAAQLAADEINAAGGINGKKLEIDFQDHKCDPKTAVSVLQQLTGEGVKVFTSAACTGAVVSMEPILQSTNSVLVSTLTTGAKLTGSSPNFFRNWGSDIAESKLFADAIRTAGYKKVVAINEQTDYAAGLVTGIQNFLKNDNVQVSAESFPTGTTDVRTQLTKLKSLNPDLIFISPQTVTTGEIILSQMEELNFKPVHIFINDNITKSADLLSKHAKLLEGAVGADYVIAQNADTQNLLQKYKAKYGTDCPQTNICVGAYDTINLLADAIKNKGYDANAIKSYLSSVNYSGVGGNISFDNQNDRKDANYSLFQVKNGVASVSK